MNSSGLWPGWLGQWPILKYCTCKLNIYWTWYYIGKEIFQLASNHWNNDLKLFDMISNVFLFIQTKKVESLCSNEVIRYWHLKGYSYFMISLLVSSFTSRELQCEQLSSIGGSIISIVLPDTHTHNTELGSSYVILQKYLPSDYLSFAFELTMKKYSVSIR